MKTMKNYCRRHPWCRELLFVVVLFGLAATCAVTVLHAVPLAPFGD